jgi:hypothetical protein
MKEMMMAVLLAATGGWLNAQKLIGIRGGISYASLANANRAGSDAYRNLQLFHGGITGSIPYGTRMSIQPSLLIVAKGAKTTFGDPNSRDYFVSTSNPVYVELPVTLNLSLLSDQKTGIYFGMGPYLAAGFSGKNRVYGMHEGENFYRNTAIVFNRKNWAPENPGEGAAYGKLRRFDFGIQAGAGGLVRGVMVSVFYDHGLTAINRLSNPGQSDRIRTRTLGVSIGYMFGRKQPVFTL